MRIISGEFRRRRLHSPPDASTTRPIPDRVKEALFNLLRGHFEGAIVLDLFAGSGSIGLEAVSRGADLCVFVERDRAIGNLLRKNIDLFDCGERARLVRGDALGPSCLSRCPRPVNLVFCDPPYPLVEDPAGWHRVVRQISRVLEMMAPAGFAVVRTPWPFVHGPPSTPSDGSPGSRGSKVAEEEVIIIDEAGLDDLDLEKLFEPEPAAVGRAVDVDLTIPGADGPETHVYRQTAVHLYVPKRELG